MSTAYIIDDELRSAMLLKAKIEDLTTHFSNVVAFTDPMTAYKSILESPPDIIFLDIEMPQINGIELLEKIKHLNIPTVYITAFSEYSIRAIKQQIFDYILKPVKEQELLETINKFVTASTAKHPEMLQRIPSVGDLYFKQNNKIPIHTSESINLVTINQIAHVVGIDNYSKFRFAAGGDLLSSRTLKFYEHILVPFGFVRAHKSHLVNLIFVDKVVTRDGGYLVLRSSEVIPISREKKQEILAYFRL